MWVNPVKNKKKEEEFQVKILIKGIYRGILILIMLSGIEIFEKNYISKKKGYSFFFHFTQLVGRLF